MISDMMGEKSGSFFRWTAVQIEVAIAPDRDPENLSRRNQPDGALC